MPLVAKGYVAMQYMILICVSVVGLMSTSYAEKAPANFGVLTCTLVKPGQDAGHKMTCGFKPAGTGAEEKYSGIIRESSQDLPSGKIVLIWTVLGPAEGKIRAGILAQRYVKATNAPGHAPVLVGETNSGIALQFETNDSAAPTRQLLKWSCSLLEPLLDEEVATERTLSAMDSA